MRESKQAKAPGGLPRTLAGWCLLAALCTLLILLGRWAGLDAPDTEETSIPNDHFALQISAEADGEGEAKEVMMLKIACLTFDDGPSVHTQEILDILRKAEVPATFFVTAQEANMDYYPLLKTAVAQGHQIALHSASHDYSKIYASPQAYWLDIKELRRALGPYVDVEAIHWLRFPGGSTNTVSHRYGGSGVMKALIEQTDAHGYEWIDWNVCAEDATASHPNAEQILRNIQRESENRDICVVLLHDTKATGQTVKALPAIVDWYKEQGYHFCTVEEMYEARDGG